MPQIYRELTIELDGQDPEELLDELTTDLPDGWSFASGNAPGLISRNETARSLLAEYDQS